MSAMMMNTPHRKPVSGYAPASRADQQMYNPQQPRYPSADQDRSHSRTRTNSSSVMPHYGTSQANASPAYTMTQQQQLQSSQTTQHTNQPSRRTPSVATTSTTSTNPNYGSQRTSTMSGHSTAGGVRRSTSSRSNSSSVSPTSYVALMRKQKATVWCDRAQNEDPRILAAQRQAKMRAAAEVAGGHNYAQPRVSTSSSGMVGGVRSKIRHHGAPKAGAYSGANMGGVGVPMRLSATEVDDGNDSDDDSSTRFHNRNGSGRNSLGSGKKGQGGYASSQLNISYSNGSTPPGHSPVGSMGDLKEEPTPVPGGYPEADDYFAQTGGSGSSGEREETFGSVGGLPQQRGKLNPEEQVQRQAAVADELRRRGSVDERTMTMSAQRLYVANPDLSD